MSVHIFNCLFTSFAALFSRDTSVVCCGVGLMIGSAMNNNEHYVMSKRMQTDA